MQLADPFGTAALRASTLAGWRDSPTRLREDAATEADLVRSGYRDRLFTELVQNAADAAARAGVPGEVQVRWDGEVLSVANTGSPLDETGVQALCALRASGKSGDHSEGVGQFGVGFTAVRAVSDEVQVRSSTGSIEFSAARTAQVLADEAIAVPAVGVPTLRLAWPSASAPRSGSVTEVVLRLRSGIDGELLVASMVEEAPDLLLELTALRSITIWSTALGERRCERREEALPNGLTQVQIGDRVWWQHSAEHARWLVPVLDGRIRPIAEDVLRAPTRSDELLSLPALVIGTIEMQPDRRRILPGAPVERLAHGYSDLVAAVPPSQRAGLIPRPGFARSLVDGELREGVLADLRQHPWVPVVAVDAETDDSDVSVLPDRAHVVAGLDDSLAAVLADVIGNLVIPDLSSPQNLPALDAVGVHRIGLAQLADLLSGVTREPQWWRALYSTLEPLVVDAVAAEELSSIPVPLSDGRTVTGPRTVLLGDDLAAGIVVEWARVVHPDAAHPLLTRLGATAATATDLLSDPALHARIEDLDSNEDLDNDNDDAATELVDTVLALAGSADPGQLPPWLGQLPIPDSVGDLRCADELLLPEAPLATVLDADSPFGVVSSDLVARVGSTALQAIGVGAGFTVLKVDSPSGPDHDLDDEQAWWDGLDDDPEVLTAVRDLDLVDPARWAQALTLLADNPATSAAVADPRGYTAWWLRRNAELDGQLLGTLRAPDDHTFAGLLDITEHPRAAQLRPALAPSAVDSPEFADVLLERLADPQRTPSPAVIVDAHRALAAAVRDGRIDLDDLEVPEHVRAIDGAVADPDDALVLDKPWLAGVIAPHRLVVGDLASAGILSDLLDVPCASTAVHTDVLSTGRLTTWAAEPGAVLAAVTAGAPIPAGEVIVHERLTVRVSGHGEHDIDWWVDGDGTTHCTEKWALPWHQLPGQEAGQA
ncbi:MAG: ATP-binding protein [Rhodococcus sp.]|nr:ATP-binding protein [Rhodococcus sp. (in: high G+C Gram-positive bacteria)]